MRVFILTISIGGLVSFTMRGLDNLTSGLTYLHGFRDRIAKRIDVIAIRKWAQEIDIPEKKSGSFAIKLTDAPEFVTNLKPDYDAVSINLEHLDEQIVRIVNLRWKFIGCLHLRVMPHGMETPVTSNSGTLEVAPGVYIRELPK